MPPAVAMRAPVQKTVQNAAKTTTKAAPQAASPSLARRIASTSTAAATAVLLLSASSSSSSPFSPPAALAAAPEKVADFAASGILFRDAVEVTALDDPDVEGASVYIADFKRSLTAKLAKDFFSEPSQASITCAADPKKPLRVVNASAVRANGGTELFSERKGLSIIANKTLRVRRVYDSSRSTLLYVSYSTRLSDDADTASTRYKTSVCALPLPESAFGNGGGVSGSGGSVEASSSSTG